MKYEYVCLKLCFFQGAPHRDGSEVLFLLNDVFTRAETLQAHSVKQFVSFIATIYICVLEHQA